MRAIFFSLLVTIVLALAAGMVGVLAGRTLADAPGEYERGVDEGERLGRIQAEAGFRPGNARFDRAVRTARESGMSEGRKAGAQLGAARARRKEREEIFAGFRGGWEVGEWYLVNIAPGGDGTQVSIGSRIVLRKNTWYGLCDRPTGLCRRMAATRTSGRTQ
jgi:hypothetical protein